MFSTRPLPKARFSAFGNAAILLNAILTIATGAISTFLAPPATGLANGIVIARVEPASVQL